MTVYKVSNEIFRSASSNCTSSLHGGGGQIGVLILQPAVQRQPPLLLVFTQQGRDGQSVFIGAAGLHGLSVKKKKKDKQTETHWMKHLCLT